VKKKATKRRGGGFAAMDRKRLRAIAREGGLAAHAEGKAHQFTSEEARRAGKKGGRSVSRDRKYMAEIGRRGGRARKGGKGKGRRRRR
jgi:uncharacterized protein